LTCALSVLAVAVLVLITRLAVRPYMAAAVAAAVMSQTCSIKFQPKVHTPLL
jgi:hypothetical protein